MSFSSILKDIKDLKIQGAHAVAIAGLEGLHIKVLSSKSSTPKSLLKEMQQTKQELLKTRPTEPFLQNVLNHAFLNIQETSLRNIKENLLHKIQATKKKLQIDMNHIISITTEKIPKNAVIFTHCHSNTVCASIIAAKFKKPIIYQTESRPVYQGRITAQQLSAAKITTHHFVDGAMHEAIKKADMILLGADAITSEGNVINKIGSALVADLAERYNVPFYICTHSLKFDPKTTKGKQEPIEQRKSNEVWAKPPKGVIIHNPAFEYINATQITGIISELGIFGPEVVVQEVLQTYPWLLT